MKGDVKAVRVTGTGSVFAGRTRLRGMILASDGGGAGSITLQSGGVTQFPNTPSFLSDDNLKQLCKL